jgi:16S rRNA (cytidine1402-2'-O)-methyltransferase
MNKGTLFLIPSLLGDTPPEAVLPKRTTDTIQSLEYFVVEERRTVRRFLRKAGFTGSLDDSYLMLFNEHSDPINLSPYFIHLEAGKDTGLLSEAGTPCIADPGNVLVAEAHRRHIRVVPLTGPNSIMLALMASGFNGQHFAFQGYLPIDKKDRQQRIRQLEEEARKTNQTQIFIETPYRNNNLLEYLVKTCSPDCYLCIAMDLTTPEEWIVTQTIAQWKKSHQVLRKSPAIFLLNHLA